MSGKIQKPYEMIGYALNAKDYLLLKEIFEEFGKKLILCKVIPSNPIEVDKVKGEVVENVRRLREHIEIQQEILTSIEDKLRNGY